MPSLFLDRVRKMRICAYVQLACIFSALISGGVFLECLFYDVSVLVYLGFGSFSILSVILIILCNHYLKKKKNNLTQYEIPVWVSNVEEVALALSAGRIFDDAYVSFQKNGRVSIRILAQYHSEFVKKEASTKRKRANKAINTKFGVSTWVPIFDVLSSLRINLVVCDQRNGDLVSWVNANTVMLLHRNEAIVSAAIILDERLLIFPACMENLTIAELKRYEAAGIVLANCLACSAEKTEVR